MRSEIKRSQAFSQLAGKLWDLVRLGTEELDKPQYFIMITKLHRLVVPPPYTEDDVLKIAEDDWQKDLTLTKTHKGHEAYAKLDYETFWRAIFQLVDTWTETTDKKEYIEMMNRSVPPVQWKAANSGTRTAGMKRMHEYTHARTHAMGYQGQHKHAHMHEHKEIYTRTWHAG